MSAHARRNLLFMCVANSARSQMAEGLARKMAPPGVEVFSAGSEPSQVNPFAIRAMLEVGIDLSTHYSKGVDELDTSLVGTVITLCAEEVCPVFPGQVERLHWPHEDPASAGSSDEERLESFRRVRDQIQAKLQELFGRSA